MSSSDGGDGFSTQTAFAVIAGVAAIVVAAVVLFFYFIRDRQLQAELLEINNRFEYLKQELQQEQAKKFLKYEAVQEFLKQYKKPILQSAFDLQSRLSNQVKNNFLYQFLQERDGGERDKNYALYNFSFVFAEFLGWLEVIRQELVFITGDEDSPMLASLIEGIKFQLTGETPVQGTPPRGKEDDPEYEQQSKIFQLYAGEMRSIGSVMVKTDADGNKSIINADEFQRLMTAKAPNDKLSEQAQIEWHRSRERLFQDIMLPLKDHLKRMSELAKGQAPLRRLAIIQVLLCKLIDLLDNAVPWDQGPKYDLHLGEEPQYISRDFRLTPLVKYLNSDQRGWLAKQPFMETAERSVADPAWELHLEGKDPTWQKLCFCGFREDLSHLSQEERDKLPDMWPGACPPRMPRMRPIGYNMLDKSSAAPFTLRKGALGGRSSMSHVAIPMASRGSTLSMPAFASLRLRGASSKIEPADALQAEPARHGQLRPLSAAPTRASANLPGAAASAPR